MHDSQRAPAFAERATLLAVAMGMLALRALAFFHYRFDSDEPQHLHVAWGWTAGLVQYRDYFDNHAPLFHMLSAPILALLGERADILLWMRATMIPLWLVVLAATWSVARRYWPAGVAEASVVLLAIFPPFFLKSIEYRTDNGWNALWAVAMITITTHRLTPRMRAFTTGLVLGTALAVSMKTPLLVVALLGAEVVTRLALRRPMPAAEALKSIGIFMVGFVVVPLSVAWFFVSRGAWPRLVYCVVTFNELVARTHPHNRIAPYLYVPVMLLLYAYARQRAKNAEMDENALWRFRTAAFAAVYMATLLGFWILISPRDMLPVMPIAAIFVAAAIHRLRDAGRAVAIAVAAVTAMVVLAHYGVGLRSKTAEHITLMNQVLALTRPGESLMDYKGETIYRKRPYFYIFELITREAIDQGLIADTVAADVIRARCHVVQADGDFWPGRSRLFLARNFLDVGRLRASGRWVTRNGTFTIGVPGQYVIVDAKGAVDGRVDGVSRRGPIELDAGAHTFEPAVPGRTYAVFWAPAFARGFSPFHLRNRDF